MLNKVKVLSFDGGGIKGLRSLYLLNEIEIQTRKKANELFDVFVGTSTGSIIASLSSYGYSAKDIIKIYKESAPCIFDKNIFWFLKNRTKFNNENFKKLLTEYFGLEYIIDSPKRLIIPTYNIDTMSTKVFSKEPVKLANIVLASSSPHKLFPPVTINGQRYIDGGYTHNNPSEVAFLELKGEGSQPYVVSIGTGSVETKYRTFGSILYHIKKTTDILMVEQSQQVHERMLKHLEIGGMDGYYYLTPSTKHASYKMDLVTEDNLKALEQDGKESISYLDNMKKIQEITNTLKK